MSIRALTSLAAVICLAVSGPSIALEPQAPRLPLENQQPGPTMQELGRALVSAGERNDSDAVLAAAVAIRDHPDFSRMPAELRSAVFLIIADNLNNRGHPAEAEPAAIRATEIDPASADGWFTLMQTYEQLDDLDAMAGAVGRGVRTSSDLRDRLNGDFVLQLVLMDRIDDERAFEVMTSLFESGWRWEHDSEIWLRLVRERVQRGDVAGAADVAPLVGTSGTQTTLHALRRYDEARELAGLTSLDLPSVVDQELQTLRERADDMDGRKTLAIALFYRGRFSEAIEVADAALVDLPADDADADWDSANWLMDTRARALMELGRTDEAIAQMERAAGRLENSDRNVSQQINLGWMYLRVDRNEDAIAAVATMDDSVASPYGIMQAVQVRACATHALGRTAEADEAFAYLSQHWRDAPGAYYDALGCRGEVDAMATLMVERLNDPDHVEDAVRDLHTYLPRASPTAFDARLQDAHAQVGAMREVIAARDVVARAMTVPTLGSQF